MKKIAFLTIFSFLIITCTTNPLTGRSQLNLVSNAELFPQAFTQYNQVLSQSQVDTSSADAQLINKVGQRVKKAAELLYSQMGQSHLLEGYEWQFTLIKSKELNAWCMPGGKVAFYSGILPVCQNEAGIATVMGHEITHALAGHSAEQMSQAMIAQYGGAIAGSAITNNQWKNIFNRLYPVGAQVGMLSYGRKMELEADEIGLYLMALAGYDPQEAVNFWGRMQQATAGQQTPPEFLSTHPNPGNRIAQLQSIMPKAMEFYNASPYKGQ